MVITSSAVELPGSRLFPETTNPGWHSVVRPLRIRHIDSPQLKKIEEAEILKDLTRFMCVCKLTAKIHRGGGPTDLVK
ncbi:hypothetical protein GE21DRAFT_1306893 [Neurospora crassa]|nr:hypothetical protein GE21DRAFT_1306893 [Neurospora crassa]